MTGECQQCCGPLDARAIVLSGGAYRVVGPREYEVFDVREAVGWLEITCDDEDAPADVRIVDHDGTCGTFDLFFCSPSCLRRFLLAQVDALEAKLVSARRPRSA